MQYTDIYIKKQDLSLNLYYKHYICDTDSDLKHKVILLFAAVILIVEMSLMFGALNVEVTMCQP
jgi:hypothetical protein